jgi:hypothetical protein
LIGERRIESGAELVDAGGPTDPPVRQVREEGLGVLQYFLQWRRAIQGDSFLIGSIVLETA